MPFGCKNTKLLDNATKNTRKMENPIKFSIKILQEESREVDAGFSEQQKAELVSELEAKYGGKVELIELRYILPILTKDGD